MYQSTYDIICNCQEGRHRCLPSTQTEQATEGGTWKRKYCRWYKCTVGVVCRGGVQGGVYRGDVQRWRVGVVCRGGVEGWCVGVTSGNGVDGVGVQGWCAGTVRADGKWQWCGGMMYGRWYSGWPLRLFPHSAHTCQGQTGIQLVVYVSCSDNSFQPLHLILSVM